MKIEQEIQQGQFKSEYYKAHINILFTASWLSQQSAQVLKPYNISVQQFNILRILRGVNPKPASVKLLTNRMIDKMSNASRLVDKLKAKGLVERRISEEDRRRVDVFITQAGLELVNAASEAIEVNLEENMHTISDLEAVEVNRILDKLRK